MVKKLIYSALAVLAVFAAASCKKTTPIVFEDPDAETNRYLRSEYMDVYYYWNEQVMERNAMVNPASYTVEQFFDKMLYPKDRWSWMTTAADYLASESGEKKGTWGVGLAQPSDYYNDFTIRISYIYPGSPFEKFGVTRGAAMIRIGGQDIEDREGSHFDNQKLQTFQTEYAKETNSFTFRLTDGRDTTFTATRVESLSTKSYLAVRVIRPDEFEGLTEPVGYFNYESFKSNFIDDIDDAMAVFANAPCKKLIVDLRYNGGGDSRVSDRLISFLAPKEANGKPYVTRTHNRTLRSEDTTMVVKANEKRFDINEIYFITGKGTASASEMVMNGLKPYMKDKLYRVGQQTYGKPNGMYVLMYPGNSSDYKRYDNGDYSGLRFVFLPICFYNTNSLGEFIPDDGFVPDNEQPDDVYHDFGPEEACIKACLTHIVTGRFPEEKHPLSASRSGVAAGARIVDPVRSNPHYGSYTVVRGR
ncbi:MAG: hypothetical protein IJU63_05635 [Bacteroidales bacterium]|nr:hypothetical protein [Bacteroidales bacterium]